MKIIKTVLFITAGLLLGGCGEFRTAKLKSMANTICEHRQGVYRIGWDAWDGNVYCYDGSFHRVLSTDLDTYTNPDVKNYLKD